ncbi:Rv1733c family protein [Prauserella rugosa]|uniref:Uncharacterized protein n=1 Tax=Prauserella rugosa TaxID=43354 RepID=A0A660CE39_9PSEU|nr:hypothetical protein [Prauserella rugosa]KMS90181.1 hypothetical protein ACZ91_16420 [Streptomyces regensis]TWH19155.1 hypothetical protein JD82_00978 [Prauserella rugosa]
MAEYATSNGRLVRAWRRIRPGRNPLARRGDRWDGRLLVGLVLIAVCAVPLAVSWAGSAYATRLEVVERDAATTHAATATLTENAPVGASGDISHGVRADARWKAPDGTERTGAVPAYRGATAGTEVTVWVDDTGAVTSPPLTRTGAAVDAATLGVTSWLAVLAFGGAGYGLFRILLARARDAAWDREWERFNADHPRDRNEH